jgi:hypothetical protein
MDQAFLGASQFISLLSTEEYALAGKGLGSNLLLVHITRGLNMDDNLHSHSIAVLFKLSVI